MEKRPSAIPTSLLLTGAVWPVVAREPQPDAAKKPGCPEDGDPSDAPTGDAAVKGDDLVSLEAGGDSPPDE